MLHRRWMPKILKHGAAARQRGAGGVLVVGESLTGLQLLAFAIASVIMATLPSRAALRMGQGG